MSPEEWTRRYIRAAKQRLTTAEFLLAHEYGLDSMYLAGYAVECAFKALILARTPARQKKATLLTITTGKEAHDFEHLRDLLKKRGCTLPLELVKDHLRPIVRARWSTDWRYEVGRRRTTEAAAFINHVGGFVAWVKRSL